MVFQMNKELLSCIDIFIDTIKDSDVYKEYLDLSYKVSKCSDINILTKKIKDMEKYLVKYPSIEKEDELNNLMSELNIIPLQQDYKDKCSELNYILSLVKDKFDNFVSDLLVNKNRLQFFIVYFSQFGFW